MQKITETPSHYRHLEKMATLDLLENMNREDQKVPLAVAGIIPQLTVLVDIIVEKMQAGGRLFYVGAGTSGRLGVLDASECPPTYGVPEDWVIGLIAGGDYALRHSVEKAEDDPQQAWKDLSEFRIDQQDVIIGIAASGTTPYVIGALKDARERGITTGCITCNPGSPLAEVAEYPIEVIVGPEFVTGSTRMKSGTAQKLILNMISTTVMIRLGRVKDNKMFDMLLSNNKLVDRGTKMVAQELGISYEEAQALLQEHGSVRLAVEAYRSR
jgi:N-acetylmuramic acid 6-phosphate etherase